MMKNIALFLAVILLLSIPTVGLADEGVATDLTQATAEAEATTENITTAEETNLPEAGITPDSWLYGLDKFMKELHLLLTFDAAEKAGLLDEISGERLAEAKKMIEENKVRYGIIAMKAYKAALEKTVEVLDDAILKEKDIDSVLSQFTAKQLERDKLIGIILEEMPEELRAEIEKELQDTDDELEVTIEVTDYEPDKEDADDTAVDTNAGDIDETAAGTDTGTTDGTLIDTDTGNTDETSNDDAPTDNKEATQEDSGDTGEEATQGGKTNQDVKDEPEGKSEVQDEESKNTAPVLPLKKQVTGKVLEETVGAAAAQMFAKGELNLRQIMTVYSLSEQTGKTFDEVLDVFLKNGKGIGASAKALDLRPKHALKEIKKAFKQIKKKIKKGFAEAKKDWKKDILGEDPGKAEEPKPEVTETGTQASGSEETSDGSNMTADGTAAEKEKAVNKTDGKNCSKFASDISWKSNAKKDKSPSEDDKDNGYRRGDDNHNNGNKSNGFRNNRNCKNYKGTNQSNRRSDRAKERSNRK